VTTGLISDSSNTARSSVVVSVTQLLASLLGGLFAVLIAVIVGEGDATDGFLAAYSAYLLLILFGSAMRVSLVPLLGSTDQPEEFVKTARTRVSEILPIAFVASLLFVAISPLLGRLLLNGGSDEAKNAAVASIALLGIAALCQIWGAVLASVLGGARRFVGSSLIYLASSCAMVVISIGLMEIDGITGAAVGVVLAAALLVVGHVIFLSRFDFTAWPKPSTLLKRESWKITAKVSAGSVMTMVLQLNLTISIGFVSGVTGIVSGYVYAYLATIMATGVTAATIGLVTMPNLIVSMARDGIEAAREYLREIAAFGTFLYVPVAVGFACFGWPIVDAVLGGSLSPSTLDFFWDAARIFLIMGLIWCMFAPLVAIALTQHKYGMLAGASLALVPIHIVLLTFLSPHGELQTAIGHAISGGMLYVLLAAVMFGRDAPKVAWDVAKSVAPCLPLAMVYVVPAVLLDPVTSLSVSLIALTLCSAVYLLLGVRFWPRIGGRMLQLLRGTAPGVPG
jgi:peptidoglycan biosynthesis protein MviN/MurJ (putative lipid II flippase)